MIKIMLLSSSRIITVMFCLLTSLWNFSIQATSLTEFTDYQASCEQAIMDESAFLHFKRNPHFQQVVETVSHESGREYLEFIIQNSPDFVNMFEKLQKNDSIGDPVIYDYGKYGCFSPTTLRYVKVACDLRRQFGDLSKMHIVEIGGGYGGQCKVLADFTGFASYTIIDLPEVLALTKKYLSLLGVENVYFIENNDLSQVKVYDLVISNYAFSEIDRSGQQQYIEHVINPTENGYLTMNYISHHLQSISIDDLVQVLYSNNRKGSVKKETPNTHPENLIVIWRQHDRTPPNTQPNPAVESGNAITYSFSGGRLGDNLLAYFHAKWIAYKHNLPLRFIPFPFADQFCLSDEDSTLDSTVEFLNTMPTTNEADISTSPNSTLFVIPYFPDNIEHLYDFNGQHSTWIPSFHVDWEDSEFRAKIRRCLTPKSTVNQTVKLPKDKITVGIHVRRGGGVDHAEISLLKPLKFPNDSYYIQQVERISKIFNNQPLHVYILTDDLNPALIAEKYQRAINIPNIQFDYRKGKNSPSMNILEDFFLIPQFDCLVICQSNFSLIASKIADHAVVITPIHPTFLNGQFIIDEVELSFNGTALRPFSE